MSERGFDIFRLSCRAVCEPLGWTASLQLRSDLRSGLLGRLWHGDRSRDALGREEAVQLLLRLVLSKIDSRCLLAACPEDEIRVVARNVVDLARILVDAARCLDELLHRRLRRQRTDYG